MSAEVDEETLAGLEQAVRLRPADGGAWADLGYEYGEREEFELAEAAFRQATRLAPDVAKHWWGLSMSLAEQDRSESGLSRRRRG